MGQAEIQVIVGIVMSFVIQMLKKASWWPFLTERTDTILKIAFAALVAAGSALAISFTFDATLGQLTVTGLTWTNVGHGALAFLTSFLSQQFGYRVLVSPKANGGN